MSFCVFSVCEEQNIVLICFAGSKLKIDCMLELYHWVYLPDFCVTSGISHPRYGDDDNGRSCSFTGPFLWLPLSITEAATGFAGLCLSVSRQMKSSSPCVGRRSAAFFPCSFFAFRRNTATALGSEPVGHRRRCLAVRAAFAPQTAVPYLLQGKGGRPYGSILWSRFSRWVPVGPCWPSSKYRHILLGVCYFLQSKCFWRTDRIKPIFHPGYRCFISLDIHC